MVRKTWFITRPERDPEYHKMALDALYYATNHFTKCTFTEPFRRFQKKYEDALAKFHIKRKSKSASGSGGRTWLAMLRTFDYIYIHKSGKARTIKPNKIARAIIKGDNVYKNIRKQVLTLQIPNTYFESSGFRRSGGFAEGFEIQPVRFLVKLANSKSLGYHISEEEIILFAMTCRRNKDLKKVINEIKKFRGMSGDEKEAEEISISKNYDHRERSDSSQRTFIGNSKDVANTFMILAEYTGLARRNKFKSNPKLYSNKDDVKDNIKQIKRFDKRYPFNTKYKTNKKDFIIHEGLDVDSYKANLHVGQKMASQKSKDSHIVNSLISLYPNLKVMTHNEISHKLMSSVGYAKNKANKYADLISDKEPSIIAFSPKFVQRYLNEPNTKHKNRNFELDTERVLQVMDLDVYDHPDPTSKFNSQNENEDMIVDVSNKYSILIDAKNYHNKSDNSTFHLTANLRNTMIESYINGYKNGFMSNDKIHHDKPQHFLYVVARNASDVGNIKKIEKKSKHYNVPCTGSIINAKCLMQLADYESKHKTDKTFNEKKISEICSYGTIFTSFDKIRNLLKLSD